MDLIVEKTMLIWVLIECSLGEKNVSGLERQALSPVALLYVEHVHVSIYRISISFLTRLEMFKTRQEKYYIRTNCEQTYIYTWVCLHVIWIRLCLRLYGVVGVMPPLTNTIHMMIISNRLS